MNRAEQPTWIGPLLGLLALASGGCALAYEILYVRALTPLLGDMFYVHAALLSTFLVGIGLGALWAKRALRWLWLIEIFTGLYALALPFVTSWIARTTILASITSSPWLSVATTISLLAIPSLLIGFSIPLFSAYLKATGQRDETFAWIYRLYNIGATVGVLLVELFLARWLGVQFSLATIGAINIVNGILLLSARATYVDYEEREKARFSRSILAAIAISSVASAVFQMFFLKLTYLVFHPHRENFAVALSLTMLGIALGAWLAARFQWSLSTVLIGAAASIALTYALYMPILELKESSLSWAVSSERMMLVHKLLFGSAFALIPLTFFGATLPSLMYRERSVARESGLLLFVSSVANAAGYLLYVFVGHPFFSTSVLLAILSVGCLAAAWLARSERWKPMQWGFAVVALVGLASLFAGWQEKNFYLALYREKLNETDQVRIYKSGAESATLVTSEQLEWLSYNGFLSVQIRFEDKVSVPEMVSGVIPALGAPRLEKALVLGVGSGITGGATARIFEHSDLVEINEAFYQLIGAIEYANFELPANEAASNHLADGRAFLVGREGQYDAIVNSIPAPTYFSASKIYTLEFYERVAKALKPDGVFCTWLSAPDMTSEGVQIVLSALKTQFSYCDLRILRGNYYMATCSREPIQTRRYDQLGADPLLTTELQRSLPLFDLTEYFEDTRISENIFDSYEPRVAQENTDDHPVLEFEVVRNYQLSKMGTDPFFAEQSRYNVDPLKLDQELGPDRMARRAAAMAVSAPQFFQANASQFLRANPEYASAFERWRERNISGGGSR